MNRSLVPLAGIVVAALAAACGPETKGPGTAGSSASASAKLPETFALAVEPAGAKPVREVVATAKTGDEVVATGRVGIEGSNQAYFSLVDASVKSCSDMTDAKDHCPTPWDYCCEPPDQLAKTSATVELRTGEGADAPMHSGSILGFHGLDHLSTVTVKGKAVKDSKGNLTILASGLFVKK